MTVNLQDPEIRERDIGLTDLLFAFDPDITGAEQSARMDTLREIIDKVFKNPTQDLTNDEIEALHNALKIVSTIGPGIARQIQGLQNVTADLYAGDAPSGWSNAKDDKSQGTLLVTPNILNKSNISTAFLSPNIYKIGVRIQDAGSVLGGRNYLYAQIPNSHQTSQFRVFITEGDVISYEPITGWNLISQSSDNNNLYYVLSDSVLSNDVTTVGLQVTGSAAHIGTTRFEGDVNEEKIYALVKAIAKGGTNVVITPDDGNKTLTFKASGGGNGGGTIVQGANISLLIPPQAHRKSATYPWMWASGKTLQEIDAVKAISSPSQGDVALYASNTGGATNYRVNSWIYTGTVWIGAFISPRASATTSTFAAGGQAGEPVAIPIPDGEIPVWNTDSVYNENDIVIRSYRLWISIIDDNQGNDPVDSDPGAWDLIGPIEIASWAKDDNPDNKIPVGKLGLESGTIRRPTGHTLPDVELFDYDASDPSLPEPILSPLDFSPWPQIVRVEMKASVSSSSIAPELVMDLRAPQGGATASTRITVAMDQGFVWHQFEILPAAAEGPLELVLESVITDDQVQGGSGTYSVDIRDIVGFTNTGEAALRVAEIAQEAVVESAAAASDGHAIDAYQELPTPVGESQGKVVLAEGEWYRNERDTEDGELIAITAYGKDRNDTGGYTGVAIGVDGSPYLHGGTWVYNPSAELLYLVTKGWETLLAVRSDIYEKATGAIPADSWVLVSATPEGDPVSGNEHESVPLYYDGTSVDYHGHSYYRFRGNQAAAHDSDEAAFVFGRRPAGTEFRIKLFVSNSDAAKGPSILTSDAPDWTRFHTEDYKDLSNKLTEDEDKLDKSLERLNSLLDPDPGGIDLVNVSSVFRLPNPAISSIDDVYLSDFQTEAVGVWDEAPIMPPGIYERKELPSPGTIRAKCEQKDNVRGFGIGGSASWPKQGSLVTSARQMVAALVDNEMWLNYYHLYNVYAERSNDYWRARNEDPADHFHNYDPRGPNMGIDPQHVTGVALHMVSSMTASWIDADGNAQSRTGIIWEPATSRGSDHWPLGELVIARIEDIPYVKMSLYRYTGETQLREVLTDACNPQQNPTGQIDIFLELHDTQGTFDGQGDYPLIGFGHDADTWGWTQRNIPQPNVYLLTDAITDLTKELANYKSEVNSQLVSLAHRSSQLVSRLPDPGGNDIPTEVYVVAPYTENITIPAANNKTSADRVASIGFHAGEYQLVDGVANRAKVRLDACTVGGHPGWGVQMFTIPNQWLDSYDTPPPGEVFYSPVGTGLISLFAFNHPTLGWTVETVIKDGLFVGWGYTSYNIAAHDDMPAIRMHLPNNEHIDMSLGGIDAPNGGVGIEGGVSYRSIAGGTGGTEVNNYMKDYNGNSDTNKAARTVELEFLYGTGWPFTDSLLFGGVNTKSWLWTPIDLFTESDDIIVDLEKRVTALENANN